MGEVKVVRVVYVKEICEEGISTALNLTQKDLLINLIDNSPIETGKLKKSWKILPPPSKNTRLIYSPLDHATWTDEGTGIFGPRGSRIVPRTKERLAFWWRKKNRLVVTPSVRGQIGQQFVRRSVIETSGRVDEFIKIGMMKG